MPEYVDQLSLDEGYFAANDYYGAAHSGSSIIHRVRQSSLLITAPHATKHSRLTRVKEEDRYTGSLALLLGRELNASVIAACEYKPDPDHVTQLSDAFHTAVADSTGGQVFLLDIHGMSDSHGPGVCIGTGALPPEDIRISPVVDSLTKALNNFTVSVNEPFSAAAPYTVTMFAQELGIPALQLEIAARFRVVRKDNAKQHAAFIRALLDGLKPFAG